MIFQHLNHQLLITLQMFIASSFYLFYLIFSLSFYIFKIIINSNEKRNLLLLYTFYLYI
jgi:hypothetical protein